jgi:hypothetical protein
MTTLEILQLCNGILALTPPLIEALAKIRAAVAAGNSDEATAALMAQIDKDHAATLALLAAER